MVDTALPIANGFYTSPSLPVSAQNCVNWFPHIEEAPSLAQELLLGTPGIDLLTSLGDSPSLASRGMVSFLDTLYCVRGNAIFNIGYDDSTLQVNSVGTISGTGRVVFASSASQLMILVPGGDGYILTKNPPYDTLTKITDADFRANGDPQFCAFVDGYFVCTTDDNGKFICSAINDGLAWNALDFGTAESSPDASMVPVIHKNQLFIVGTLTCEQQANVPNGAAFPFRRTGLFLDKGTRSPYSVVSTADTFMFLGAGKNESPCIWALDGNSVTKVSTLAIDSLLQRLSVDELAAVFAWNYSLGGHFFVGFTLPDTTIVFDVTTKRWHERQSNGGAYRADSFALIGTDLYVSDTQDGRIGTVSTEVYTEYGDPIIRTFTTQPYSNNMLPFFVPKLELTTESGVGLPAVECCFGVNATAVPIVSAGTNISRETAQDVSPYFSKAFSAQIQASGYAENVSTVIPHADISGFGGASGSHWFRFTVCEDGAVVFAGVESDAFDPILFIYNNDSVLSATSGGYLSITLNAGTYWAVVSKYFEDDIPEFAEYSAFISVSCFEQAANAIEPTVRLQISRDGGKTFGNERSRPLGKIGEYNRRAVWRRNGRSSRFDVYRFIFSDPVKPVAIQLVAQIEGGDDASA